MSAKLFQDAKEILKREGLAAALSYIDKLSRDNVENGRLKIEVMYAAGEFQSAYDYTVKNFDITSTDIGFRFLVAKLAILTENFDNAIYNLNALYSHEQSTGNRYFGDSILLAKAYALFKKGLHQEAVECLDSVQSESAVIYGVETLSHVSAGDLRKLIERAM